MCKISFIKSRLDLKKYLGLFILLFAVSCIGYHRVSENEGGEPILSNKVSYTFTDLPSNDDLSKVDTTAYYVQVFEGRQYNDNERKNPLILIFHNDGYFKSTSVQYLSKFEGREKKSAHYGGKYRIVNKLIELEMFYPLHGGKTNYYSRAIRKGIIDGDRIILDDGFSLLTIYEKKYDL